MRNSFKIVQLSEFPDNRGQAVLNERLTLAGKDASQDDHPNRNLRFRTDCTRGHALFNAGDTEPTSTRVHQGRNAECKGVTIGIGLDNGQKLHIGSDQTLEKAKVVFKGAGTNLNPAGARLHGIVQGSVYGIAEETMGRKLAWDCAGAIG